jgi:thymidylate kinase
LDADAPRWIKIDASQPVEAVQATISAAAVERLDPSLKPKSS